MEELLEKLKNVKQNEEQNLSSKEDKILDICYYGKINLSKNDGNLANERTEELYLVKKEMDGKESIEFRTEKGLFATIQEDGQIEICGNYREVINTEELLLQLQKTMPLSLNKLQEIQQQKNKQKQNQEISKGPEGPIKEHKNSNELEININKKITETETFADLVPEVKEKGIESVKIRRKDATNFTLIGMTKEGQVVELETLQQTEGTNPKEDIVKVNHDGSKVQQEQVLTMLKIRKRQKWNQRK